MKFTDRHPAMDPKISKNDWAHLARSHLFRNIDIEYLRSLLDRCACVDLASRDMLLSPGQGNDDLYVILEGQLKVHLGELDYPPFVILRQGECAGELSIIDGQKVSAYVVADGETRLLVIPGDIVWSLINSSHGIARNLLYILSHRMRADNEAAVTSIKLLQEFQQAATVDGLTGLHNRRWLNDAFRRQFERCRRNGEPVAMAMADIDHFKRVNDTWGHPAGDRVLIALASTLRASLRPSDLIARYGGEEFCVLLPETPPAQALDVAERLRVAIAEAPLLETRDGFLPPITISIGVSSARGEETFDELLTRADTALYRAKAEGRNRVCVD